MKMEVSVKSPQELSYRVLQSSLAWKGPQHPAQFKVTKGLATLSPEHPAVPQTLRHTFKGDLDFFLMYPSEFPVVAHFHWAPLEETGSFSLEPLISEVPHSPSAPLSLPFPSMVRPRAPSLLTHHVPKFMCQKSETICCTYLTSLTLPCMGETKNYPDWDTVGKNKQDDESLCWYWHLRAMLVCIRHKWDFRC